MAPFRDDALAYHERGRPGKIAVVPTKPLTNQRDLSLAYSPGVAEPCLEIKADADRAYRYTAKGNLVAVVSNGTAVLGLGNIGALAGKPVMEGKGNLFKQFADLDVFDLEVGSEDPEDVIRFCQLLEPTVGGINLEDIRAPDCFLIEQRLRETMRIPVFHDDQHGTAIISGAALLNALEITGKDIAQVPVVFSGAGAAAIATAEHYVRLGVPREHIVLCDRTGVVTPDRREHVDPYKARFANDAGGARTLADAMENADVFVGLSVAGAVTGDMVARMAPAPIVFALANPVPEVLPDAVRAVRPEAIIATGRSDYPNQVNNVLGFPFIFRGALDARATEINEEMKMAATRALAALAREEVPDAVARLYGLSSVTFGRDYLIPFPFDHRVLLWVAPAVAWAAVASGVARDFVDLDEYRHQLEARLGRARGIMRGVVRRAVQDPRRVVFPEGTAPNIVRAARILADEGIAQPVLLGRRDDVETTAREIGARLDDVAVEDPFAAPARGAYARYVWERRQRKGLTLAEAEQRMLNPNYFGAAMVALGHADALVSGATLHYPEVLRPALEVIGPHPKAGLVSGMHMMVFEKQVVFCGDTTINIAPTAEQLAQIGYAAARIVRTFGLTPRVAMLSYSNFGSVRNEDTERVARAVQLLRARDPGLVVDGEMQADTALEPETLRTTYPFSALDTAANVLIFPNLSAGNIAYKLLYLLGGATAIGPILLGMRRPVHVLERGADVEDIVNMAAVAVMDAQQRQHPTALTRGAVSERAG
jgi:malate dehydrogenase (oxaloacetate-decarboxylating)(NADP+)